MTRPTESNSRPPAVVWPPVDSGGLPVLAARRQMVLLCGYVWYTPVPPPSWPWSLR